MTEEKKDTRSIRQQSNRDHPEQYPTEKESLFDMYESERTVDAIPMEDLRLQQEDEKRKEETKRTSSSERKYGTDK